MAACTSGKLVKSSSKIIALTDNLENFLSAEKSFGSKYTVPLKNLYDASKVFSEDSSTSDTLQELIISGFDDEQIWQQLELENESCISSLLSEAAKVISNKNRCSFKSGKFVSSKVPSKSKRNNKVAGTAVQDDELTDRTSNQKKRSKDSKVKNNEGDYFDEGKVFEENLTDDNDDDDDDELADIEKKLDEVDKDDKFFDFTGDSDEDLNFDFGPLGQKGDLDEELFNDDSDNEDSKSENQKSKSKKKKSVSFKDQTENESHIKDKEKISQKQTKKLIKKGSIVDDAFFKLAELEEFLDQEDRREERKLKKAKGEESDDGDDDEQEENIDMFAEIDSAEEEAHYEDFFDPPEGEVDSSARENKKTEGESSEEDSDAIEEESDNEEENSLEEEVQVAKERRSQDLFAGSDSEGEDISEILGGNRPKKSSYEIRQERLKKKISAMEDDMLSEKPWQLAGEVTGGKRPENSLLQENLQFEHTTRLPPEITEETTKTLEDLIKQRIKDKAWDDVERKVKPKDNPFEYKKRITLDQEKSKLSLNEIYEQEYLKQQKSEEVEKTDPDHDEIKKMMQSLFIKLDALSNFHYTPKQASAEVKVITNQPSITMEEVAPVSVSEGKLLAPEEIKDKERQEVKGSTEKTASDRLRERKLKKKNQRIRKKEQEKRQKLVEKLNPGLGNKYSKEKALKKLEKDSHSDTAGVTLIKEDKKERTGLTSSKAFFTQLQEEVTTSISRKRSGKNQNLKRNAHGGKKFKL